MAETTVKKVQESTAPSGREGENFLVSGKALAMRSWSEGPGQGCGPHSRDYETVGYVIEGKAKLHLEDQVLTLEPGDAWLVPAKAEHRYEILENFRAVEATSPPARMHR
jgi:quercetin dioxygenase-like cupin family protein